MSFHKNDLFILAKQLIETYAKSTQRFYIKPTILHVWKVDRDGEVNLAMTLILIVDVAVRVI